MLDHSPGENNVAAVDIVSVGLINIMLRGAYLLELVSLERIADYLGHGVVVEGYSRFNNELGAVEEVLENAGNEAGRPPVACILALEERIELAVSIIAIADHLHGKKVIGGALIVLERSAVGSGLVLILLIEAYLGADEHKAVLTLPKLKHIIFASALFVCAVAELDSDCIVIHDSEAGAEVIQRVEAELLLPGVEVVNIEVLTLGIILIGEDGALIKRIQTELNGDGGIDIVELTEKVVRFLVLHSLLKSRNIIAVLEVVTGAVNRNDFRHALGVLLLDDDGVLVLSRSVLGLVGLAGLYGSICAEVCLVAGRSCAGLLVVGKSAVRRKLALGAVRRTVCDDVRNSVRVAVAACRFSVIFFVGLLAGRKCENGSNDKKQC